MPTRADVVAKAVSFNGYNDGTGFPGPYNVFERATGFGATFYCGIFVTAVYDFVPLPLPSMQAGMAHGFAYVPDAVIAARSRPGGWLPSWQAQPADLAIFSWGDGLADHVEICTAHANGELWTIGGDSGPSNVDRFQGQGGVHRHVWSAPVGVGNQFIMGVLAADKFVTFDSSPTPSEGGIEVQMPLVHAGSPAGQIENLQRLLNGFGASLKVDGQWGPETDKAVKQFQTRFKIGEASHFGQECWHAVGWGSRGA